MTEILPVAVEHFAAMYAAFVAEVKQVMAAISIGPDEETSPAVSAWRSQALPALERGLSEAQVGVARFQIGDPVLIVQCANETIGLSKHLDGFPLDFAGPGHEEKFKSLLHFVVLAAYNVYSQKPR